MTPFFYLQKIDPILIKVRRWCIVFLPCLAHTSQNIKPVLIRWCHCFYKVQLLGQLWVRIKQNSYYWDISIFQFEDYSQKEAVAFLDDCTVYLTDEVNNTLFNGGKLYSINLCSYLNTVENKPLKAVSRNFNSSTGSLKINFKGKIDELIIFDGKGIMIKSIKPLETDSKQFFLGYEIIPGLYTFTISSGKRKYSGKILIN